MRKKRDPNELFIARLTTLGDVPTGPLSKYEIMALRRIIRADDRTRWFWTTVRIWTGWLIGIPAALVAVWTIMKIWTGGNVPSH